MAALLLPAVARAEPPTACFTVTPAAPLPGETTTLDSSCSNDDPNVIKPSWDLDNDGRFDDGNEVKVTWSRATPGEYTVRLRVRAPANQRDVESKTIIVGERPPQTPHEAPPQPPPPDPGPVSFDTPAPLEPVLTPVDSPVAPLRYLNPFPVVRMRGRTAATGARLTVFSVRAPHGSQAELRCFGRRCPVRKTTRRIRSRRERGSATIHFKQVERFLPAGIELQVRVTQPGMVGKYARLRVRRKGLPLRSDACLLPGSTRPVACPAVA